MTQLSRRELLAAAAAALPAAAATAVVTAAPAAAAAAAPSVAKIRRRSPNDKFNIAGVGIGGMGHVNLKNLASENIVALCDVDPNYAARTFDEFPAAKRYVDFRDMLEKQHDIDAVLIATPDHTHAVITLAALRAGKHVYCQKPLTHNIFEARTVAKAAAAAPKLTTQMGIQGHSGEGIRLIREWIEDGAIGEVREVAAWCNDSYYPWGHQGWSPSISARPTDTPEPPAGMNWDLWIGPAPLRPYHGAYHPMRWRAWWDFGSSWMADRGAHTLDPIVWALGLAAPTSIDATSLGQNEEMHCIAGVVTFRFAARGQAPPVVLRWYEGMHAPRPPELADERMLGDAEGGALFYGSKGLLMCGVYGQSPRLIPESRMKEYKRPEPKYPRIPDTHEMEWVRACKEGRKADADFAYGALISEICQLGNVAKRMDGRIDWDAAAMKVTNRADANKFISREYRKGWEVA